MKEGGYLFEFFAALRSFDNEISLSVFGEVVVLHLLDLHEEQFVLLLQLLNLWVSYTFQVEGTLDRMVPSSLARR
jgi:hypothetical protein